MTNSKLTASDVLRRYQDEYLPEFSEIELHDVNQVGIFGTRPIHVAASRGSIEEVIALLEGGADVNAVGELGNTPLHDAVGLERAETVKVLLKYGATSAKKNEWGQTPLDMAVLCGRKDIADLMK